MLQLMRAIPTNIVTGFLGSGKTSLIRHLLDQKPTNEYWAVLVNEFGDIGLDGALLNSQGPMAGVAIRELPGGCMCCTLGVPMQVTLNRLLKEKRPDRLLIEPTGLGHPAELIAILQGEHYKNVLQLEHTITLLDARKLSEPRYTNHDIFQQQLAVADVIVANKSDLYSASDRLNAESFVSQQLGESKPLLVSAQQGAIALSLLSGLSRLHEAKARAKHRLFNQQQPVTQALVDSVEIKPDEYQYKHHAADGYTAMGWRFGADFCFHRTQLTLWLSRLACERAKAVIYSNEGWLAFNKVDNHLDAQQAVAQPDSRLEVIGVTLDSSLTEQLLALQVN